MTSILRSRRSASFLSAFLLLAGGRTRQVVSVAAAALLLAFTCLAQDQPTTAPESDPQPAQGTAAPTTVTIPAGTRIGLVLTHSVLSRNIHRGDDIYAQITFPVNAGNEVVIPPGAFVQGKIDKLDTQRGRGELHLQSLAITFPDGYVTPVAGPMTLESDEGYALKDPGKGRSIAAFTSAAGGAGLGALIGHSAASSQGSTITNTLPPGCTGPPPGCLTSSLSVPANKGKDTVIGAAVGGAIGMVASILMLTSSHHFFLDVGTPVEMTLERPLTLEQGRVADAVRESEQHPVAGQAVAPRRVYTTPPPDADHGTCYTPGTPGTPDTVIPGPPGPDGIPGPPTIIPGIPATPGMSYPCP